MNTFPIDRWHIRPDIVRDIARKLHDGETVLIPTDSTWAIICDATKKKTVEKIRKLRATIAEERGRENATGERPLSLMCSSLSDVGRYTLLNQPQFRLVKRVLPGPYTILLPVSLEVPRTLHTRRKVIGIRMPDHDVAIAILEAFGSPVFCTTARRPDGDLLSSTADVTGLLVNYIDNIVETEPIVPEPSTVVDATVEPPTVVRAGKGELEEYWL